MGSEFGHPPFSFICVEDRELASFRVLNELPPLLKFLKYSYHDRVTQYLQIPRKPCNPVILDFREEVPDVETFIKYQQEHRS